MEEGLELCDESDPLFQVSVSGSDNSPKVNTLTDGNFSVLAIRCHYFGLKGLERIGEISIGMCKLFDGRPLKHFQSYLESFQSS